MLSSSNATEKLFWTKKSLLYNVTIFSLKHSEANRMK